MAALVSCASTTDAYPVGQDTYRISATADTILGGEASAKTWAARRAKQTCARQGKTVAMGEESTVTQRTQTSTMITFKCVAAS